MNRELAEKIRKVTPYTPGEQPKKKGIIKLNTNENPYPPSEKIREAIQEINDDTSRLRLYPDPDSSILKEALARHFGNGLSKKNFFTGVGSDDVLGMAFLAFFNGNEPVLFPDITYSFYEVWAELFNVKTKISNLDENMRLVKEDFLKNEKLGGIVIANPNAPTGLCEPVAFIKEVALAHPECLLIVDEAYVDFGGESAVSLVNELPNLLVAQTFSKSRSLAGLRIGYAVGNEELVAALEAVRYSYNSYTMNMPVQLMGSAILADEEYFNLTVKKIVNERERTKKRLKDLGFSFPDSKTNFIFVKHEKLSGEYIFNELKKRKIYVRHFKADKIKEYNRITIGTPEQMDKLIDALVEIVAV